MRYAATPVGGQVPLDGAILAAAAKQAAAAAAEGVDSELPSKCIDAAIGALHEAVGGLLPSVFVLEHGRLWLIAQRGYAVVPDGLRIERGVMGRAVRLGIPQHAMDVRSDPDYVPALPGVCAELAVPLRVGQLVVGALNLESERALPENAAELLDPLASVLGPLAEVRPDAVFDARLGSSDSRRQARADGSILAAVVAATAAIDREDTAEGVSARLCKALVFSVGATACSVSRIAESHLLVAARHSVRDVPRGEDAAYRIDDFPVTAETLRTGMPRAVSFLDGDVDPAEAFLLREFGMNALLILALRVEGEPWGLVELYEMRLRRFSEDEIAVAHFLTTHAERRLAVVGTRTPLRPWPRVYELPSEGGTSRGPRTR